MDGTTLLTNPSSDGHRPQSPNISPAPEPAPDASGVGRRWRQQLRPLKLSTIFTEGYEKEWLAQDALAGTITAAVVIPKAMAYATIAGVSVQAGLYTVFMPTIVYSLIGSSRVLSVTTSTTLAILTAANMEGDTAEKKEQCLATLSLLVGAILILASVLRLGFVAEFISEPVLIGFKAGIGVVIVVDQLPKLFGLHISASRFLRKVIKEVAGIPDLSWPTFAVGFGTIAVLCLLKRYVPRLPAPLLAVAGGISVMAIFHLDKHGVERIGDIPRSPPPITLPNLELIPDLWGGALGLALMSFTETIAAGRAFARATDAPLVANQELLATGLANVAGAFFGAMPGGGGTTQTAVNRGAGAVTQVAGFVTALIALITMLVLAPLISLMPEATLAAVVIVYSIGLIKPAEFRNILKVRQMEFLWALVALAGVVFLGTLKGILVAIIVSLASLTYQVVRSPVQLLGRIPNSNVFLPVSDALGNSLLSSSPSPSPSSSPSAALPSAAAAPSPFAATNAAASAAANAATNAYASASSGAAPGTAAGELETFEGLLITRFEGRIFFANAQSIREQLRQALAAGHYSVLLLDLSATPDVEYTALTALVQTEARQREAGVELWISGANRQIQEALSRTPLAPVLCPERCFRSLELAVAKYQERNPSGSVCRREAV